MPQSPQVVCKALIHNGDIGGDIRVSIDSENKLVVGKAELTVKIEVEPTSPSCQFMLRFECSTQNVRILPVLSIPIRVVTDSTSVHGENLPNSDALEVSCLREVQLSADKHVLLLEAQGRLGIPGK